MDSVMRDAFIDKWRKYFADAPLPVCFYYGNEERHAANVHKVEGQACVVGQIARARRGETLAFDKDSITCGGGKRYLGYTTELRPGFEYFLSTGIEGVVEGERYKKTPEIVKESLKHQTQFEAPGQYIVFKRWDTLEEDDHPEVVIFFAKPDVISGVFTLSGFEDTDPNAVIAPFGAGCATIVQYPYIEKTRPRPRAVLGMFDVSARPCVDPGTITLAVPMEKFTRMVANMDESFLITESWAKVRRRMKGDA